MSLNHYFKTFGLFVRHPRPGLVKLQLAKAVGRERAAELYEAFVFDLVERFRHTADRRVLGFAPDEALVERYFEVLGLDDYLLWPQPPTDLATRLRLFFSSFLQGPNDLVLLAESDCPTLPLKLVNEAFELLETHDCVVGPAAARGWYLLGLRGKTFPVFEAVAWGGPRCLAQLIQKVHTLKISLAVLPPWYEVHSEQDVEFLKGHLSALRQAGQPALCPETEDVLKAAFGYSF